jgi:hypothetical protein
VLSGSDCEYAVIAGPTTFTSELLPELPHANTIKDINIADFNVFIIGSFSLGEPVIQPPGPFRGEWSISILARN